MGYLGYEFTEKRAVRMKLFSAFSAFCLFALVGLFVLSGCASNNEEVFGSVGEAAEVVFNGQEMRKWPCDTAQSVVVWYMIVDGEQYSDSVSIAGGLLYLEAKEHALMGARYTVDLRQMGVVCNGLKAGSSSSCERLSVEQKKEEEVDDASASVDEESGAVSEEALADGVSGATQVGADEALWMGVALTDVDPQTLPGFSRVRANLTLNGITRNIPFLISVIDDQDSKVYTCQSERIKLVEDPWGIRDAIVAALLRQAPNGTVAESDIEEVGFAFTQVILY